MAPFPGFECAQLKWANCLPYQMGDREAQNIGHPPNLPFAPFAHDDFQSVKFGPWLMILILAGAVWRLSRSNAAPPLVERIFVNFTAYSHPVTLLMAVAGMGELVGQVAVIGHEDEAHTLFV